MRGFSGFFGSEVFRPIVTLVIPGFIWTGPYLAWLGIRHESIKQAAESTYGVLALLGIAVFCGMVLEGWGALVEIRWDTKRRKETGPANASEDEWYAYLCLAFSNEPIGHRYLRTMVLNLKFELAAGLACILAAPGVCIVMGACEIGFLGRTAAALAVAALGVYLVRWESWWTHGVLCRVRHELLKRGVRVEPADSLAPDEGG